MPKKTRILIAPDKFKGSLTARQVADALAVGITLGSEDTAVECRLLPLADGGDGSVDAALAAGFIDYRYVVSGPTGHPVQAIIAFDGATALIEVANTCGIALLPKNELHPLDASSFGFGEAILYALTLQPRRIVLALGGSASTDGGMGMLAALGCTFRNIDGSELHGHGRALGSIATVEVHLVPELNDTELIIASDVHNPLLGSSGCAAVFGPQKGASVAQVKRLDNGLAHLVHQLESAGFKQARTMAGGEGAGSAGGIGFACMLLGARRVSGAEFFLDLLGFDVQVQDCDIVITGEGSIDEQTLAGKLPAVVAERASTLQLIMVAGQSSLSRSHWSDSALNHVYTLDQYTDQDTSSDPDLSTEILHNIGVDIRATFT